MDWLGAIRSCKRKDASGEHVPPLAVSKSPHWYQATLDESNRMGRVVGFLRDHPRYRSISFFIFVADMHGVK